MTEQIYKETGFDFLGEPHSFRGGLNPHQSRYCEVIDAEGPVKIGYSEYDKSMLFALLDPTAFLIGYQDFLDGLQKDGEITESEVSAELKKVGSKN